MRRRLLKSMLIVCVLALTACGAKGDEQGKGNESGNSSNVQSSDIGNGDSDDQNSAEAKEDKGSNKKKKVSLETLDEYEVTPETEFEIKHIEGGVRILKYTGDSEVVVIPETIGGEKVLSIAKAFYGKSGVKAVRIADTVEKIDTSFFESSDLQYVKCGAGLKEIANASFGESGLMEIELNEGLEIIGPIAFANCTNLKEIYIPESVTDIQNTAFYGEYPEDFVIRGKAGSVAETYANEQGYKFEAVE